MGAMGSVVAIFFGIFWTVMASSMGGPVFFPIFGVMFIGIGVVQLIYNVKNAIGKNRMSIVDITEDGEEKDPLDQIFVKEREKDVREQGAKTLTEFVFCPYCGQKLDKSYRFCPACGKSLND
jgi:hypothetical protein